jgi:ABC-type transport system involved in multi-copper enzyme maturation permease subunit
MPAPRLHPPRVFQLLRQALRRRGRLVGLLLLAGILTYLGLYLVQSYYGLDKEFDLPFVLVVVFGAGLGGIALASDAFQERQTRPTQDFHLTLPATRLELLVVQCVLLGVLYPVAVFVAATLAAVGAPPLAGLFFAQAGAFSWADHLHRYWQVFVPGLLVCEAIFLLGSAYFRPNAFAKTWTAASVAAFCVMISVFAAGYAAFKVSSATIGCNDSGVLEMQVGTVSVSSDETMRQSPVDAGQDAMEEQVRHQQRAAEERAEAFAEALRAAAESQPWLERQSWWGGLVLLPLFCLVVAYVRLREQEA